MTTLALPKITGHEAPSHLRSASSDHRDATGIQNQDALRGSINVLRAALEYDFQESVIRGFLRSALAPLSSKNVQPATLTEDMAPVVESIVETLSASVIHPDTKALLGALDAYCAKQVAA